MQITPSTFSSGLSALQSGQRQVDQAASAIASSNSSAPSNPNPPVNATPPSRDSYAERQPPNLSESLVALRVGEHQAQAGAKLVRTADEVLGTLINTRA